VEVEAKLIPLTHKTALSLLAWYSYFNKSGGVKLCNSFMVSSL